MTTPSSIRSAPLPGPPDPWASTRTPSLRSGPPYHMTDMIEAEPALARRILARHAATAGPAGAPRRRPSARRPSRGAPIVVTGCGTSRARGARGRRDPARGGAGGRPAAGPGAVAAQAFELSLDPPSAGLVIGVSHEGGTAATIAALAAARAAGARTALLTVSSRSPARPQADPTLVVETGELDQSWCHTVGYVSPMVAAAAVGAHLSGRPLDDTAVVALLGRGHPGRGGRGPHRRPPRRRGPPPRRRVRHGPDGRARARPQGRGGLVAAVRVSAISRRSCTATSRPPDRETGLVIILTDRERRGRRLVRAQQALAAARAIGIRAAAILVRLARRELDPSLTPAGRLLVPDAPDLPAPVASLFGSATPLQLLTERLARARGTNPDPIRRDDPTYLAAADAAELAEPGRRRPALHLADERLAHESTMSRSRGRKSWSMIRSRPAFGERRDHRPRLVRRPDDPAASALLEPVVAAADRRRTPRAGRPRGSTSAASGRSARRPSPTGPSWPDLARSPRTPRPASRRPRGPVRAERTRVELVRPARRQPAGCAASHRRP